MHPLIYALKETGYNDKTKEPKRSRNSFILLDLKCSFTLKGTKHESNVCLHFYLFFKLSTEASTSSQPGQQQVENDPWRSSANTPTSRPSSTDSSSLCTRQMSPQIGPGPQISDPPADSLQQEVGTPATSSALQSEPQENPAGSEQEVGEEGESKSCKKHLHCPTCKVTVNSSSQLEAHCSGVCKTTDNYISSLKDGNCTVGSIVLKEHYFQCNCVRTKSSVLLDESGSRHKQMLDGGRKGAQSQCRVKLKTSSKPTCRMKQRMGSRPRVGLSVSRQPFHCKMCQVSVNSETQLKQVNTKDVQGLT